MLGHVGDSGSAQPGGHVVPAERPAGAVRAGVVAVAAVVGEVDAPDERQLAVDHHGLLVMAVEGVLAGVAVGPDPGIAYELVDRLADLGAGGMEHRHGRA